MTVSERTGRNERVLLRFMWSVESLLDRPIYLASFMDRLQSPNRCFAIASAISLTGESSSFAKTIITTC